MAAKQQTRPSLESLIESEDIGIEILHPGGLEVTRETADLCHVGKGAAVLDVASGTGESSCFVAETLGCSVTGIDACDYLIEKARQKAAARGLGIVFVRGDAHHLPFSDNSFDAVMSECTMCILDKAAALREMTRVARRGGYVGMHDLCWKDGTPERIKLRLAEIEDERPETIDGWKKLLEQSGLTDIETVDKSHVTANWAKEVRKTIGLARQAAILVKVIKRWGLSGYRIIAESERIFGSKHTGYGIVVGRKP